MSSSLNVRSISQMLIDDLPRVLDPQFVDEAEEEEEELDLPDIKLVKEISYDHLYRINTNKAKVVVLGDRGVGKSSIINNFLHEKFIEGIQPTQKTEIHHRSYRIDNVLTMYKLCDFSGVVELNKQVNMSVIKKQYETSQCLLIIFDLTNKESF